MGNGIKAVLLVIFASLIINLVLAEELNLDKAPKEEKPVKEINLTNSSAENNLSTETNETNNLPINTSNSTTANESQVEVNNTLNDTEGSEDLVNLTDFNETIAENTTDSNSTNETIIGNYTDIPEFNETEVNNTQNETIPVNESTNSSEFNETNSSIEINETNNSAGVSYGFPTGFKKQTRIYSGNKLLAMNEENELSYVHEDFLGSPKLETTVAGLLLNERNYQPFGYTDFEVDAGYTGHETGVSGLNAGARNYDAQVRRWKTPDPVLHDSESPYAYVSNNPLKYTDPDGQNKHPVTGQTSEELIRPHQSVLEKLPKSSGSWKSPKPPLGSAAAKLGAAYSVLGLVEDTIDLWNSPNLLSLKWTAGLNANRAKFLNMLGAMQDRLLAPETMADYVTLSFSVGEFEAGIMAVSNDDEAKQAHDLFITKYHQAYFQGIDGNYYWRNGEESIYYNPETNEYEYRNSATPVSEEVLNKIRQIMINLGTDDSAAKVPYTVVDPRELPVGGT